MGDLILDGLRLGERAAQVMEIAKHFGTYGDKARTEFADNLSKDTYEAQPLTQRAASSFSLSLVLVHTVRITGDPRVAHFV